jgi:hypothetical protein
MPPQHATDRTGDPRTRRAHASYRPVTGTVPSGLLPQNGKGRRCQRRPDPLLKWGHRQSEVPRPDGRQRPLVPHHTSARPERTAATPMSRREVA